MQLQMIIQQKMQNEKQEDRAESYQNIYKILMDNVLRAKGRLAHLGQGTNKVEDIEETDRRILR